MRAAIQIEEDRHAFAPGEALRGRVGWQVEQAPKTVELRLFHYTRGRGTRDVEVVEERTWTDPGAAAQETFEFSLPAGPYSFTGKLVSLIWGLELVLQPGSHTERVEIVLSPNRQQIDLYRHSPMASNDDDLNAPKQTWAQRWGSADSRR